MGSLDILLIKTDDESDHCLREAVNFQFPKTFKLSSFILIFHNPINTRELYDKYKLYFINPKIHEINSERNALKLIDNTLSLHGFSIQDFGLPDISSELMEYNDDIEDGICIHTLINEDDLVKNDCQHKIFTEITRAVSCDNEKKSIFYCWSW